MYRLLSFCDCPFWILWLLPFLLGILLGWFIWGVYRKYRAMYDASLKENKNYKSEIKGLNRNIEQNKKTISTLEGELALSKGRNREWESQHKQQAIQAGKKENSSLIDDASDEKFSVQPIDDSGTKSTNDSSTKPTDKSGVKSSDKSGNKSIDNSGADGIKEDRASFTPIPIGKDDPKKQDTPPSDNEPSDTSTITKEDVGAQPDLNTSEEAKQIGAKANKDEPEGEPKDKPKDEPKGEPKDKYAKLKANNLQIIEGIGPKMEKICKDNGIDTWEKLASQSTDDLNIMLQKYGDRYRIIDPEPWPVQAAMARDRKWDDLVKYQKMVGGARITDSKLEKTMIKLGIIKQWKDNDLKAIEGIGPKIESLLNNNGITTWQLLSEIKVEKLNAILDAAGARYKLADPTTWPEQAKLAAAGKFDELEKLQDEI